MTLLFFFIFCSSPSTLIGAGMKVMKMQKEEKEDGTIFTGARLPPSLLERVGEYCKKTGATRSGVIRVALENFLDKWKNKEV